MKKPEFVAEMAEKSGLTKTQADAALAAFLEVVTDAVVGKFFDLQYTLWKWVCATH
jgi:nucleoid DNA-binding protein